MSASNRMADAAFNRSREGLRVLEDLARFVLNDPDRVEDLKRIRHDLTEAAAAWPGLSLVLSRDTAGDVGTEISTTAEGCRRDLRAVAAAAGRRATEALRSLEELAKVEASSLAAGFERMRYELYDLAGGIEISLPFRIAPQWRLCVLLTEARCRLAWSDVAEAAIEGGADCLQLREKSLETGELLDRARHLVTMARPRGVAVMINDRVDVALASGADGVHVGADDLPVSDVRAIAGNRLLVGATARTHGGIQEALLAGASIIGIGPMFVSATKPGLDPVGPERLEDLLPELGEAPHLAIGGIDASNASRVHAVGGRGVAACGCICDSNDPAAAAAAVLAAMGDPQVARPGSPEPVHGHA